MSVHSKFDREVKITRKVDGDTQVSSFDFKDTETTSNQTIVIADYFCTIIEKNIRFGTGKEGDQFSGSAVMKGELTDKIQAEDVVDGEYKVLGDPRVIGGDHLVCNLVRI